MENYFNFNENLIKKENFFSDFNKTNFNFDVSCVNNFNEIELNTENNTQIIPNFNINSTTFSPIFSASSITATPLLPSPPPPLEEVTTTTKSTNNNFKIFENFKKNYNLDFIGSSIVSSESAITSSSSSPENIKLELINYDFETGSSDDSSSIDSTLINEEFNKNFDSNFIKINGNIKSLHELNVKTENLSNEKIKCKEKNLNDKIPYFVKEVTENNCQIKIWICAICNKEFQHQYSLLRHRAVHTDDRNFKCTECGKTFRQVSTLNQHRVIHSINRPYICEICLKSFNRISTLISHRKIHTEHKIYQCHLCEKSFHQKGNLRNHIYIHTNERPYKCKHCNRGFNQISNLMCHIQKTHEMEANWSCYQCDCVFKKRNQLRAHEYDVHQIERVIKNTNKISKKLINNDTMNKVKKVPLQITTGIVIPAINTMAMKTAKQNREIPFAVLHLLEGVPLLVRIHDYGNDQSILRPANKDDFLALKLQQKQNTNKISVPIVAAVYQTLNVNGTPDFTIKSPNNIYQYTSSSSTNDQQQTLTLQYEKEISKIRKKRSVAATKSKPPITCTTPLPSDAVSSTPQPIETISEAIGSSIIPSDNTSFSSPFSSYNSSSPFSSYNSSSPLLKETSSPLLSSSSLFNSIPECTSSSINMPPPISTKRKYTKRSLKNPAGTTENTAKKNKYNGKYLLKQHEHQQQQQIIQQRENMKNGIFNNFILNKNKNQPKVIAIMEENWRKSNDSKIVTNKENLTEISASSAVINDKDQNSLESSSEFDADSFKTLLNIIKDGGMTPDIDGIKSFFNEHGIPIPDLPNMNSNECL